MLRSIALVATLTCLSACGDDGDTAPKPAVTADPAARFCLKQGGEHYISTGTCQLPDGREVDALEYYREQGKPGEIPGT